MSFSNRFLFHGMNWQHPVKLQPAVCFLSTLNKQDVTCLLMSPTGGFCLLAVSPCFQCFCYAKLTSCWPPSFVLNGQMWALAAIMQITELLFFCPVTFFFFFFPEHYCYLWSQKCRMCHFWHVQVCSSGQHTFLQWCAENEPSVCSVFIQSPPGCLSEGSLVEHMFLIRVFMSGLA